MKASIFNDVIGPVMRGPSSSHCAGALRIGLMIRDIMGADIKNVHITYDINGSLIATHKSQGTDMGLCGGFLGWSANDPKLPDYEEYIHRNGINIKVEYADLGAEHPNTFFIDVSNNEVSHRVTAISTGGGMVEIISLDGVAVSVKGDYYELFIRIENEYEKHYFFTEFLNDENNILEGEVSYFNTKSSVPFSQNHINTLVKFKCNFFIIEPVLPVTSKADIKLPFLNCSEMFLYNKSKGLDLAELAVEYETARSSLSEEEVISKMVEIVEVMQKCLSEGLEGTDYSDRIYPAQTDNIINAMESKKLLEGNIFNLTTLYVNAIMESKSAMQVIVAAPTAGSCGVVPSVCLALQDIYSFSDEKVAKALLVSGLIGIFIVSNATFAAEDAGCMAECGSASGMASAAAVYLAGGTVEQCISAASMALQNCFGMICDPVANRVEAPCLGKNVMTAVNALACANLALSGIDALIPLDEVITAMDKVGKKMPVEHCCTGLGGIAETPTAKEIEKRLKFTKCC